MSISGIPDPGPISAVREGMRVVDARGEEVGTVDAVRMGDPEAVTDAGESPRDPGLVSGGEDAGVSQQAQHQLERVGYVRIDRSGLLSGSAYAAADEIARVDGDQVHLTKDQDALITS